MSTVWHILKIGWDYANAHGLTAAAVVYLWHLLAGSKAKTIEQRVKEAARIAFSRASAAGVPPAVAEATALDVAKRALAALKVPLSDQVLALLKHELDLLAADYALAQAPSQFADLAKQLRAVAADIKAPRPLVVGGP